MNGQTDRFRSFISIMIAVVTVLASVTAFLQSYASTQNAESDGRAKALSIEATKKRLTGALQFSYDWQGAFGAWREVDLQVTSAELAGDEPLAERYRSVREEMRNISPLLQEPYFSGEPWTFPDSYKYEADVYLVEATRLSEQFAAESEVGNNWNRVANAFVIQLSLLAVTLSLFGLSSNMKGLTRGLFVTVGSGIVLFNIGWTGILLLLPMPQVNMPAIEAYAKGYGQRYQAYTDEGYQAAIELFNQAIAADPDYANAYYERGNAYYDLGDYNSAIADYETALDKGRNDANVRWNLGWTYYLVGRYEDAYAMNRAQIADDPTLVGVRYNQALVLLARGDIDAAVAEYQEVLKEAERQVIEAHNAGLEPSAGLWFYTNAAALDLQNLVDRLAGSDRSSIEAPPAESVAGDHNQIIQTALEQIKIIKEASVALEYYGRLPDTSPNASTEFVFGHDTYDENGNFVSFDEYTTFDNNTSEVTVYFEYHGDPPQHQVLWKIYQNGIENRSFREEWEFEDMVDGSAWYKYIGYGYTNVFVLPPAEYRVELYVDYRLIQTGTFFVEE